MLIKFWSVNLKRRDHFEDLGVDRWMSELRWKVMDWIHSAQDKDQWRDLVNTAMNLRVP
jgi:hypothetical protein